MARAFANISFTADVKQVQTAMGSRQNYQQFEAGEIETIELCEFEQQFIEQRDSFYQATVAQNGWPYVQHRGGPAGFIKILDSQTIGYADFTGNRQYISVGNLHGDDRVSLILMDYQQQRRLKLWGRARLIDETTEPALIAQLEPVNSRAPVERGVVITIEAFDWNCPKYITPRFTLEQVQQMMAEQTATTHTSAIYDYKGHGAVPVVISAVEQITDDVRSYTFTHREKHSLPTFQAGAHITVPIQLADGSRSSRSYSLINTGLHATNYRIAVKKDNNSKGGSTAIHQHWQVGTELNIEAPENYFGLHQDSRPAILIAGGIGITAIMAMAEELNTRGVNFELHYTSSTSEKMAFMDQLLALYGERCHLYFSREQNPSRLDISTLITKADPQTVFYLCGPQPLLQQALKVAEQLPSEQRQQINYESFQ